ncbi:MAG: 1-acyl-sn-glycerol-3-phosphate acyltransferase [Bacteroidales bacterium]|nr:1-acyl-sn-glycerol-3-phosphate acyltransferase [Bacteroidales bacterium]
MAKKSKIQDRNVFYSLLRPHVDFCSKHSYRRFEVHGQEHLPKEGALIYGINHSNTLMDALVVLATSHHKKVFMARGDIFANPTVAKILRFLRILPLFRIRNGVAAVKNNTDSMEQAVDVVHDQVGLYMFPEGRHRTKHSLLQLSKGIFHIAMDSNKEFGEEQPVYIVPVGIEYGDYFRYRSTCMVHFGEAINVTDFIRNSTEENEAVVMNQLRAMLSERISKLITYIPDDEDYEATWEMVKMKNEKRAGGLFGKMLRNRATVEKIQQYKEQHPEEAKELFSRVMRFSEARVKNKISVTSTAKRRPLLNSLWKLLLALVGLPYFIASTVLNALLWIPTVIIKSKLKDRAWGNTVCFGGKLLVFPLILIGGTIALFCTLPWYWALVSLVPLTYSYDFWYDYQELVRRMVSDIRWAFKGKLRKQYQDLKLNELF